jgi:hypothetical protein
MKLFRFLLRLLAQPRDGVSAVWLQDHQRRVNGSGIDGVCWKWPIPKE